MSCTVILLNHVFYKHEWGAIQNGSLALSDGQKKKQGISLMKENKVDLFFFTESVIFSEVT